jgi:HKD family nuclease
MPLGPGQVLHAVLRLRPDGTADPIERPLTPLLDTTILTNAPGEPAVAHELRAEIPSADAVDVVIAFIRFSGIRGLLDVLRRHCQDGKALRVLTTTYTNSTEPRALDVLAELGADVRVSYDTSSTRLHAKAWIFHRGSGYSTAYIGSSNLTHMAQVTGLEWNVRVSGARNPDVVGKMDAVFTSYWASHDFAPYDPDEFRRRTAVEPAGSELVLSPIEIELRPFQTQMLERLAVAREQGHHRNLLVAATGTGKTVMAAADYARVRRAWWERGSQSDLFAFTLDKSVVTATTQLAAISFIGRANHRPESTARQASAISRQAMNGTNVVLFARLRSDGRAFWCLGAARCRSHEGDRPIAFVWELDTPLPTDLYTAFAAAVA